MSCTAVVAAVQLGVVLQSGFLSGEGREVSSVQEREWGLGGGGDDPWREGVWRGGVGGGRSGLAVPVLLSGLLSAE